MNRSGAPPRQPGEVIAVQLTSCQELSLPSEWSTAGPVAVAVPPALLLRQPDAADRVARSLQPWRATMLPACQAGVTAGDLASAIARAADRGEHIVYATVGELWADEVVQGLALARTAAARRDSAGDDQCGFRLHVVEAAAGRPRHVTTTPLDRLAAIMERLLGPDGCPWDREQTHASLGQYLVEEAAEALEAIERGSTDMLADELGDVLLQIAFHAAIAAEADEFDLADVTAAIEGKMIHRHPHVFADWHVEGAEDVLANWELLKAEETLALPGPEEPGRWRSLRKAGVQACLATLDFAFATAGAREDTARARDAMLDAIGALRNKARQFEGQESASETAAHDEKERDG